MADTTTCPDCGKLIATRFPVHDCRPAGKSVPVERDDCYYLRNSLADVVETLIEMETYPARTSQARELQTAIVQAGRTFRTSLQQYLPEETKDV